MFVGRSWHGHKWALPKLNHLKDLLLQVHHAPDEARRKGKAARDTMLSTYSYDALGPQVLAEFDRITAMLVNGVNEL